jgi:hypothetical protein
LGTLIDEVKAVCDAEGAVLPGRRISYGVNPPLQPFYR